MIEWLNDNEGAVVGLATVALVVVTVVYVVFTYRIVQLTRAASAGAQLTVTAIVDDGKIGIASLGERHGVSELVTNSGPGPAFDFQPRLALGAWWSRSVVHLEYLGDGPDELSGTAVAYEPTALPKGRHDVGGGASVTVGSSLEDSFGFYGPEGWEPPTTAVRARFVVRWRDGLGRHKTARTFGFP